jgi:hypothetical protein
MPLGRGTPFRFRDISLFPFCVSSQTGNPVRLDRLFILAKSVNKFGK